MKSVIDSLKWVVVFAVTMTTINVVAQAASAPTKITVQGRLTDPSGTPAPAGSKPFVFKIYDAATLGTEIWPNGVGENQDVNTDANGLWTAEVGSVIPLTSSVFGASTRWLQITVNGEALSRIPINTTPYAYRVATLDGAEGGELGDTLGVRDPGGNVAVYGANGIAYTSSGGAQTGPEGISFVTDQPDTLGLMDPAGLTYWKSGSRYAEFGQNGVLFFGPTGDTSLTISDWTTPPGHARFNPAGLTYWKSGLRYAEFGRNGILFFSPTGDTSLTISDWTEPLGHAQFSPAGLIFKVNGDTGFVAFTDSTNGTDEFKVGINTGHPMEALTVGGTARILPEDLTPTDPWIGARRSMVIAQESADEWGRSTDDSAGIFLPANSSDFCIISSKTSTNKTTMRFSVGDDPDDHILLMPSGKVGIGTTSPQEKLTVSGTIYSTSGGVKFPDASVQTSAAVNSGVAQAVGTNTVPDPFTTIEPLLSVTISCPAAGFVLVMGSADIQVAHLNGSADFIDVGVSDSDTLFPADQRKEWVLPSTFPTATYLNPISSQKIFSVPSAGAYTFHLIGERVSGLGTSTSLDRTLSVAYFPVSYGTVSLSGSGQDFSATASDTPLPSTPDEVTRLRQELAVLRGEVDDLKSGQQR